MWTCPKCGREFERTNQGHYCGEAPKTVLEYIDSQPMEKHAHLTEMMIILQNSVPGVNERILCRIMRKKEKPSHFLLVKSTSVFMQGVKLLKSLRWN